MGSPGSVHLVERAPQCARSLYFALETGADGAEVRADARAFLDTQLGIAARLACPLPDNIGDLAAWSSEGAHAAGVAYAAYLQRRRAGGARTFFPTKAHALAFLNAAAPTKLVDGAWLFGLLARWQDADYLPLITTYLEELGDGLPGKNHVLLYRRLLESHGCEHWQALPESHFVQGAIQSALACHAEHFLPEVIGFNLGYEQLPLHLLITSYELNELGIDPYYFTLHISVDNASSGHAMKAVQALHRLVPQRGDAQAFYQRVKNGFRLNDVGLGTNELIARIDLQEELTAILQRKSVVGKNLHSDYCRIGGRTVNEWLAQPSRIPAFLAELTRTGWIRRGVAAGESRFWRLVDGDGAKMWGVFSQYEQQVLRDWIECPVGAPVPVAGRVVRRHDFKAGAKPADAMRPARPVIRPARDDGPQAPGFSAELHRINARLSAMKTKEQAMSFLLALMAPARHHTAAGLMATRVFRGLLRQDGAGDRGPGYSATL